VSSENSWSYIVFEKGVGTTVAVRRVIRIAFLCLSLTSLLGAQGQFSFGTLGPGGEFDAPGGGNGIDPRQSIAQRFRYDGPDGYMLSRIRLALIRGPFDIDYQISLWSGPDMNSASRLETWGLRADRHDPFKFQEFNLFTLPVLTGPALSTSAVYWLSVESTTPFGGGWAQNSQGIVGVYAYILRPRPGWTAVEDVSMAFDMTATEAVVPEPAVFYLFSSGLLLMFVCSLTQGRFSSVLRRDL
jgi:hypothetical protein